MSEGEAIVAAARNWIGTPYRHQASAIGAGADCLGLVRGVWRERFGHEPEVMPAYTPDWSEASGVEVLLEAAQRWMRRKLPEMAKPGDVLVFRMHRTGISKHLGILSSDGVNPTFIHSYSHHGVIESALTDAWRRKIVASFEFPCEVN